MLMFFLLSLLLFVAVAWLVPRMSRWSWGWPEGREGRWEISFRGVPESFEESVSRRLDELEARLRRLEEQLRRE